MTGDQALALRRIQLPGRARSARRNSSTRGRSQGRCSAERARGSADPRRGRARRGRGRGGWPPDRIGSRRAARGQPSRPAIQSLTFGTVRWFFELEAVLARLQTDRMRQTDHQVRALALVGLYQLAHGATPEHAAVSETVEAARELGASARGRLRQCAAAPVPARARGAPRRRARRARGAARAPGMAARRLRARLAARLGGDIGPRRYTSRCRLEGSASIRQALMNFPFSSKT